MSKVLANEVKKSSIAGFSLSYAAPEQVSPRSLGGLMNGLISTSWGWSFTNW